MWFSTLRKRRPAAGVEPRPPAPPLEAAPDVWRVFLEQVVASWSAKSWDRQAASLLTFMKCSLRCSSSPLTLLSG